MSKVKIVRNKRNNIEWGKWGCRYRYLALGPIEFRYYPDQQYQLTVLSIEDERPFVSNTCPVCNRKTADMSLWATFTENGTEFICNDCVDAGRLGGPPAGTKIEMPSE